MAPGPHGLLTQMGQRLRAIRVERGRTQDEVAERAGYTGKYISEIERGLRDVPLTTLQRIVEKGLGSPLAEVFGPAPPKANPSERKAPKTGARASKDLKAILRGLSSLPSATQRRVLRVVTEILRLAKPNDPFAFGRRSEDGY